MDDQRTTNRISRRQFLVLGSQATIAAMAIAACGPSSNAPAPAATQASGAVNQPPGKVPATIEFLAWGDTTDGPAWDKLAPAYMAKFSNQTIKVTPVADPNNNFYTKLQTLFAGGTPPNLASFQGWEWQVYADKNLMAPIDDYIKRDKLTAPYPDGITSVDQSVRRKGKTYLIPLQMATMVMFYAKKLFDDAGVKYPTDDWTFEQFLDTAKKVTNTSGASKKFGYQPNGNWFRDIGWIVNTGKREFDNIIDPKKSQFNTPEIVSVVQTVAYDVIHTLKVSPTPADQSGGANTINTGNCAMKYEGPWFLPQLNTPELRAQSKQVEFDVVRMPKGANPQRAHRGWAEGVAIPKSDKADAAWDFAAWMASDEGDKIYCEVTGRIPNNLQLAESWWVPLVKEKFGVSNGKAFLDAFKVGQIDVVSGVPRSKMNAEVVKPVGWDPLGNGTAKAADVLAKVDEKLQKMLDDYWKTQ